MTAISAKKIASSLALAAIAATGLTMASSAPAEAAVARNGVCEAGEVCFYYNSNVSGSLSDFTTSVSNYGTDPATCYVFKSAGSGQGLCIKNNVASVRNASGQPVRVYYNSGYAGSYQDIPANSWANLNTTLKNNNASHQFIVSDDPVGGSYTPIDNYPYKGQTTGLDPWNFYKGQCTSWSAWALRDRLGIPFTNQYKGATRWGNAHTWDDTARQVGVPTGSTPRPGAIAVRNSGTYGHVAFVTKVFSNGTFEIEEYNHVRPDTYSRRTTSVGTTSDKFDTFIYFK